MLHAVDDRVRSVVRLAALALGKGEDTRELLRSLEQDLDPLLSADLVAEIICTTAPVGAGLRPSEWPSLWPRVAPALQLFAADLERLSGHQHFARRMLRALERHIVSLPHTTRRFRLGMLAVESLECTEPMPELAFDSEVELVRCEISLEQRAMASIELPACDGRVSAHVLSDAVAVRCAWAILGRFFACAAYPQRGLSADDEGLHDRVGWATFLQELWGLPDLDESGFYTYDQSESPARIVSTDTRVEIEVSRELPAIEARDDPIAVDVIVGGVPVGTMTLRGGRTIFPGEIRAAVTAFGGVELSTVAVREALLGLPLAGSPSLRQRLAASAAKAHAPDLAGLVLARRDPDLSGTSASRRASFPAEAADDLVETAGAVGEELLQIAGTPGSGPPGVVYAPDVLPRESTPRLRQVERGSQIVPPSRDAHDRLHFESLFAASDDPWDYGSEYERTKYAHTLALLPRRRVARALEIGCAEGRFTAQLAPRVRSLLAVDVSEIALARAAERCSEHPQVRFASADIARDPLPGPFDLVVCSEVLYYVDRTELPAVAQKLSDALEQGGHLLTAHANVLRDQPDEPGFVWDHAFGAKVIGETLALTGSLQLVREIRTPLYRVQLYRRPTRWRRVRRAVSVERDAGPLPPRLVQDARLAGGDPPPAPEERPSTTDRLPILMYHRVTEKVGHPSLAPFRLSPGSFEQQLRYLRDTGHRTVGLEEWRAALERKRPISGRGVVLTFDDGDAEFAEIAWPLLQQYGFTPIVFLVAGLIGGTNAWDAGFGESSPLLDWPEIERLQSEGVIFGSHSETHPALTGLTNLDVVREATRSRRILEVGLGLRVDAFAYPYGAVDPAVEHLVGACGYTFGLTCRTGRSRLVDTALDLPRIEVSGVASFDAFVRSLDA
jgi:peptidoglycan/xylan/chitin deacetylase (PgdA/CDA1 family)/2-polyprenyl-3-methyl-5-hydroxy-6-metoxy-1,4-benzoquinol methylase